MKSRQIIILENVYKHKKPQKEIAENLGVSESYVSQIVNKSRMLQIPLKFIEDKLVCTKCEKEDENLVFHHNHSTGEYIALVCQSCNLRFNINDFEYKGKQYPVRKEILLTPEQEKNWNPDKIRAFLRNKEYLSKLYEIMTKRMIPKAKLTDSEMEIIEKIEEILNYE